MNGSRAKALRLYCGYGESSDEAQNKWTRRLYRAVKKRWTRLSSTDKAKAARHLNMQEPR